MKQQTQLEIERKYLMASASFPFSLSQFPALIIEQGYLHRSPTIRIRRQNNDYILTIKGSGAISREEYELPITEEQYASLSAKVEPPFIKKTRYLVPLTQNTGHPLTAEIDLYDGSLSGLVTIEVEFPSQKEADAFVPPDWFGKDVSLDHRYKNATLAACGLPAPEE